MLAAEERHAAHAVHRFGNGGVKAEVAYIYRIFVPEGNHVHRQGVRGDKRRKVGKALAPAVVFHKVVAAADGKAGHARVRKAEDALGNLFDGAVPAAGVEPHIFSMAFAKGAYVPRRILRRCGLVDGHITVKAADRRARFVEMCAAAGFRVENKHMFHRAFSFRVFSTGIRQISNLQYSICCRKKQECAAEESGEYVGGEMRGFALHSPSSVACGGGCFSVSHREIVGVQPTKKNSARHCASRTALPQGKPRPPHKSANPGKSICAAGKPAFLRCKHGKIHTKRRHLPVCLLCHFAHICGIMG